ncbi:hypothetical protein HMN09_01389400 [Mycena chlorophos]|uniref:Uncharacterized protein n=1 Tax=Mycena chlorophos TaxID=658473 RepID=A0A8H6RX28_MYCCL|nr:hypothetical protein HMN09_01389400 [Mycena chlorophos]
MMFGEIQHSIVDAREYVKEPFADPGFNRFTKNLTAEEKALLTEKRRNERNVDAYTALKRLAPQIESKIGNKECVRLDLRRNLRKLAPNYYIRAFYEDYTGDTSNVQQGFLKSPLLVNLWRAFFVASDAEQEEETENAAPVEDTSRTVRKSVADLLAFNGVVPPRTIAYTAVMCSTPTVLWILEVAGREPRRGTFTNAREAVIAEVIRSENECRRLRVAWIFRIGDFFLAWRDLCDDIHRVLAEGHLEILRYRCPNAELVTDRETLRLLEPTLATILLETFNRLLELRDRSPIPSRETNVFGHSAEDEPLFVYDYEGNVVDHDVLYESEEEDDYRLEFRQSVLRSRLSLVKAEPDGEDEWEEDSEPRWIFPAPRRVSHKKYTRRPDPDLPTTRPEQEQFFNNIDRIATISFSPDTPEADRDLPSFIKAMQVLKFIAASPRRAKTYYPVMARLMHRGTGLEILNNTLANSYRYSDWPTTIGILLDDLLKHAGITLPPVPAPPPAQWPKFRPHNAKALLQLLGQFPELLCLRAEPLHIFLFASEFAKILNYGKSTQFRQTNAKAELIYSQLCSSTFFKKPDERGRIYHPTFALLLRLSHQLRRLTQLVERSVFHPAQYRQLALESGAEALEHRLAVSVSLDPPTLTNVVAVDSASASDVSSSDSEELRDAEAAGKRAKGPPPGRSKKARVDPVPDEGDVKWAEFAVPSAFPEPEHLQPGPQAQYAAPQSRSGCPRCRQLRPVDHCLRYLWVFHQPHDRLAAVRGRAMTDAPPEDRLPCLVEGEETDWTMEKDLGFPIVVIRPRPDVFARGCQTDTTIMIDAERREQVGGTRYQAFSEPVLDILRQDAVELCTFGVKRGLPFQKLGYGKMAGPLGEAAPTGGSAMQAMGLTAKQDVNTPEGIASAFKVAQDAHIMEVVSRSLIPGRRLITNELAERSGMSRLGSAIGNMYYCFNFMAPIHLDDDASAKEKDFKGGELQPCVQLEKSGCKPGEFDFYYLRWGIRVETVVNMGVQWAT